MLKNKLLLLIYFLLYLSSFSINVFSQGAVIKTIVIDAGHGGHDSGCLGASKYEKTVCLSIALKLGELIKNSFPNLKVVYTRDKDIFIELHERAAIANRNKADLFICIHANSASPSAYGAETYVLGLHKTESQKQVAERENSIIKLEQDKGARYKNIDLSPDALIAIQLQMAIYLDQSIMFAERVQSEFKAIGRHDRGVRQAGFLVLHQTTMPSVLIETGFLTNLNEEKFLGSNDGQQQMANSIFKAFKRYKNKLEGISEEVTNDKVENKTTEPEMKPEKNQVVSQKDKEQENKNASVDIVDSQSDTKGKVIFKIQFDMSEKQVSLNSSRFKGLKTEEYTHDGVFKYVTGFFLNDFNGANTYKNEVRKLGFSTAFVVAFLDGERINLEKGIKLAQN
ncbi:MAG: N-acetylmuramoyl-L-alanine amidase [Bacteroidetes bacterium]|nr:N-acetylmuramoyl-L-alanine amidase [Bacteroidota bacterium]